MSVISILHTSLRSMEAASQALAVAGNNIANERTPGYAKQRLILQPAQNHGDRLLTGAGVTAVSIQAVRDVLIENRLREEKSNTSSEEVIEGALEHIEVLFNDAAGTGMLNGVTELFNSFHALALDPTSINAREEVRIKGEDLARSFTTRGQELYRIRALADQNIDDDVQKINTLSNRIATISSEMSKQEAAGQTANDLRTQRYSLVSQLSELVDVREVESKGNYQILIAGTGLLVSNGSAVPVSTQPSATTGFLEIKAGNSDITSNVSGGSIYGRLQVRDQYVPDYLAALDQLAYEITEQVNLIHAASYDRSGNTGVNFFEPLAATADASLKIEVSGDIVGDVSKIATAKQSSGKDNEAASEIGNLLHVQKFTGGSVIDQYRSLVFRVGNDTANATGKLDQHISLLHQLEDRRDATSGVSVDEETMKILQFQRSYQASASLIRIVDELLQTVLSMGMR